MQLLKKGCANCTYVGYLLQIHATVDHLQA